MTLMGKEITGYAVSIKQKRRGVYLSYLWKVGRKGD